MLTLLIGTDWVANSDALLNMVSQDVADEKTGRILMVPELISHDTERRLCAVAGDTSSRFAEVLSFTRLARRVADSCGTATCECMDNGGRIVAMAAATRQLHSRLKAYAAVETKPEFLQGLLDAVDEFKRCCISSVDLKVAASKTDGSFAQKLEELSLILETYDSICAQGKKDPRDQMTWLLEELEAGNFAREHVFYIDGFPDFTVQHMEILIHLIRESAHVVVSLNCDCPGSTTLAFEKTGETALQLLNAAKKYGVETNIINVPARQDELSFLRKHLFQGRISDKITAESLHLFCTDTQYHECLVAAERIQSLVLSGARYRDINLIYTDPSYVNILEMVLERSHIPAYFSGTEPILSKTVITAILTAVDTALTGFEKEDVIRYLKSPLSPLDFELRDKMENYALLWNIDRNGWLQPWRYHPNGLDADWDEKSNAELQILENARNCLITPLIELRDAFHQAKNVRQQVKGIYLFFCAISLDERLEMLAKDYDSRGENRNAQVLNQLWNILMDALEQLHDVLGETTWDCKTFTRLFRLLLSQYDVGTIPTVLDSVAVGPVNAMRCQRAKHLFVVGVLEGCMPGYGGSTGILTDQERTTLRNMGVPLTGGSLDGLKAEFSEIYGAFCGAHSSVTASHPDGQPSFVYKRLMDMTDAEDIVLDFLGAALSDDMEACAYFARSNSEEAANKIGIGKQYSHIKKCVQHDLGAVSEENILSLYGNRLNLSASQIDKLADCRFHFFMRYGIRAKELRPATVDPAEFGTYVHAVLENTARDISQMGGFHKVTLEQALEIAQKHSREYALQRFQQLDAERVNYLFNRNTQELEWIVRELWSELSNSEFEPVGFEVAFGDDAQLPAVDCSGTLMQAKLRGFVDRVDRYCDGENTYFRVVDYKTGKKDFDYCDVYNGLGLQMLLYMFALENHGEQLLGDNPLPAGVQYFPARVPYISSDKKLSEEEAAEFRKTSWKRSGLLLADDGVLEAMGSEDCVSRFPFRRKKDGSISGDVAKSQQFQELKKYVFHLLRNMVDDVATGKIEPNPYTRGSKHNACSFCPYGAVCHMAMVENRRNYRAISADEFWNYVQQEVNNRG